MAGIKIVNLPALGRDLISTDLFELSLVGGSGSRKITGQEIMNASKLNVGATPIINGTVGRILFQGAGDVLGESANLFWDNTNGRLGIGTSSPTNAVDITQTGSGFLSFNRTAGASAGISITNIRTGGGQGLVFDTASFSFRNTTLKHLILDSGRIGVNTNDDALTASFNVKGAGATSATKNILFKNSANTDLFTIWDDGAIGVATSTNAGFKLDVNGTARVQNTLTVNKGGNNYFTFEASANGTAPFIQAFFSGGFDLRLNLTTATTIGALSVANGLTLFNNSVPSNAGLVAGSIGATNGIIAVTGSNANMHIASTAGTSSILSFRENGAANRGVLGYQNGTTYMQIRTNSATDFTTGTLSTAFFASGNVGINTTTDAGFKLDVNGASRVSGNLTLTNGSLILSSYYTVGDGTYSLRRDYLSSYDPFRIYTIPNQVPLYLGSGVINTCVVLNGVNDTQRGFGIADDGTPSLLNSAVLQLNSTKRGFLPPRMTNAQRTAIASPAAGLIVYCTDSTEGLYVYKSTGWTFMV